MSTKLEKMDLTELAHQCEKVARNPKAIRAKAQALYNEWTSLVPGFAEPKPQDKKEAKESSLKARMIEFLTAVL